MHLKLEKNWLKTNGKVFGVSPAKDKNEHIGKIKIILRLPFSYGPVV